MSTRRSFLAASAAAIGAGVWALFGREKREPVNVGMDFSDGSRYRAMIDPPADGTVRIIRMEHLLDEYELRVTAVWILLEDGRRIQLRRMS